jgi:LuxR family maltose regulon positive regulatory protein
LIARASKGKQLLVTLEAILLRAQMYAAIGDSHASQADYFTALKMAEPEGFIGVFVEHGKPVAEALAEMAKKNQPGTVQSGYIECILNAFSGLYPPGDEHPAPVLSARIKPMALIDSLTDRELVVLRLMAEGLKYKEIAARLFISQNTVRFHVKAIYGKLNVNNRMQAIEKARQLLIL